MKKSIIMAFVFGATASLAVNAQYVEQPKFFDNISVGVEGGVTTPMHRAPFFKSMRGIVGAHIGKQITPVLGAGVEANFSINTSNWPGRYHSSTAFDNSYLGVYATADLFNLFGGYDCRVRPFTIETVLGAGWGHDFYNQNADHVKPENYFMTKAGLNFNFNVNDHFTIAIKPFVAWNMGGYYGDPTCNFNINKAMFNLMAGFNYRFGNGFRCVQPYDQAQVDQLNGQINDLRAEVAAAVADAAANTALAADLQQQLTDCQNKAPEVVKEVSNIYNSVRFVFFKVGSHTITSDQMPNVEMIAEYMANHPTSKVVIKGYASPEGNYEFNVKLAQARAEAVKTALVKRYKIAADRITAEGEGIGNMFEEASWNRVSVCTLEQQ